MNARLAKSNYRTKSSKWSSNTSKRENRLNSKFGTTLIVWERRTGKNSQSWSTKASKKRANFSWSRVNSTRKPVSKRRLTKKSRSLTETYRSCLNRQKLTSKTSIRRRVSWVRDKRQSLIRIVGSKRWSLKLKNWKSSSLSSTTKSKNWRRTSNHALNRFQVFVSKPPRCSRR